ncbi:MAG: hypothetical protein R3343_05835 [Nitriliruptorales bacterium]|nr:hypothetical protein [Nitriliruptorales bacterium]
MSRARVVAVVAALLLTVGAVAVGLLARIVNAISVPVALESLVWPLGYAAFASVGAVVLWKRPRHPIGWMFLGAGALGSAGEAALALATANLTGGVLGEIAGWVVSWIWAPSIGLTVWSFALFPSGSPLNRWMGWVGRGAFALTVTIAVSNAVLLWPQRSARLVLPDVEVEGPVLAIVGILFPPVLLAALLAIGAMVVRYRRSRGVERQQLKVLAAVGVVAAPSIVLSETVLTDGLPYTILSVLGAPTWFAVAAGVAILRYRLFDIDRIISRTVSYAAVTAILVGVYAGGVLGLGALARAVTGETGDLVVALSTLLVAALFAPLRRRVQAIVDRRFNRTRADAWRTSEEFGRRLRQEVEIAAVSRDLRALVTQAIEPAWVSLATVRRRS